MKGSGVPAPEDLQKLLSPIAPAIDRNKFALQAAVLILIYRQGRDLLIPLTVRSSGVPVHAGQISLPGGRIHVEDVSFEATALRETHEEIGVQLGLSNVLGCLPAMTTNSGYEVTPVVASCAFTPEFRLEPREVDELIHLPLQLALDISQYKRDSIIENGLTREFYFIDFAEYHIWGATARILHSLACLFQQ